MKSIYWHNGAQLKSVGQLVMEIYWDFKFGDGEVQNFEASPMVDEQAVIAQRG